MGNKTFVLVLFGLLLVWLTAGCSGQTQYEENVYMESGPTSPLPEPVRLDPAQTVAAFYSEYIAYVGDDFLRTEKNPLVDGVYRRSEYLSPRFIREIDDYVAVYNPYGFDPILLAAQAPDEWTVADAVTEGDTAVVEVQRTWPGLDTWLPMKVFLRQENGRWLIDEVTLVAGDGFPAAETGPEEVAAAFYTWYLAYTGSPAAGEFRSPLADRAYASTPYLTAELVAAMDVQLAQMRAREMGGADPFLCAQNIPVSFSVPDAYRYTAPHTANEMAQVVLHSGFYGSHYLLLTLAAADDGWRIDEIDCASMFPAGTADAFYTWYLGTIGDRMAGEFDNPLVSGVYRHTPFLTPAFVERVDDLLADPAPGGYDPFLQAQDIPHGYTVLPGPGENEALVEFYFLDEGNEPYGAWRVLVTLVGENGHWLIDHVAGQNVPAVAAFHSAEYGFSFLYPADWEVAALDMSAPGGPEDWPVVASWQVMPADIAAEMAAQTGPPDPNAPPLIAPFQIDVVLGDETAVARAYRALDEAEIMSPGRKLAYVLREAPGYSQIIFPHPYRADTWIVIIDWVTEFPGREALAAPALPVLGQLENSLQFHK